MVRFSFPCRIWKNLKSEITVFFFDVSLFSIALC